MKDKIWCRSCGEWHEIDNDVPLNKQWSDHTWGIGDVLRLKTNDDYIDEEYDRQLEGYGL